MKHHWPVAFRITASIAERQEGFDTALVVYVKKNHNLGVGLGVGEVAGAGGEDVAVHGVSVAYGVTEGDVGIEGIHEETVERLLEPRGTSSATGRRDTLNIYFFSLHGIGNV